MPFRTYLYPLLGVFLVGCEEPFLHDVPALLGPTDTGSCAPGAVPDALTGMTSPDRMNLSWELSEGLHEGVIIERREGDAGWAELARTSAPTTTVFSDPGISRDTRYSYRARAFRVVDGQDCVGTSSNEVELLSYPKPVLDLLGVAETVDQVRLSWRHENEFAQEIQILRRTGNLNHALIGTVSPNENTILDIGLVPGTFYDYRVVVQNTSGESSAADVTVRAWENPVLSWTGSPDLSYACELTIPGDVMFAGGATVSAASGSISRATDTQASGSGIVGTLNDLSSGEFQASWTIDDDQGGTSSIPVTLNLQRTPSNNSTSLQSTQTSRNPMVTPRGGPDTWVDGRQLFQPGCSDCSEATGIGQVVTRGDVTCALEDSPGVPYCWGDNIDGQVGIGAFSGFSPTDVCAGGAQPCASSMDNANRVVAGAGYVCALRQDSTVACWGEVVGNGTSELELTPDTVCSLDAQGTCNTLTGVTQLKGGRYQACAIAQGSVYCWGVAQEQLRLSATLVCESGSIASGDCVPLQGAIDVAPGKNHACALLGNQEVVCWGEDTDETGALGNGDTAPALGFETTCGNAACTTTTMLDPIKGSGVGGSGFGGEFTCGLQAGVLYCWGHNYEGRLGTGDDQDYDTPVPVCTSGSVAEGTCVPLGDVHTFDLGTSHACAVAGPERTLYCWGDNYEGQLGVGHYTFDGRPLAKPVCATGSDEAGSETPCIPQTGVGDAAAASTHSCFFDLSGDLFCFGNYDVTGHGNTLEDPYNPAPVCPWGSDLVGNECLNGLTPVSAFGGATRVFADHYKTCVTTAPSDEVWCFGWNYNGELGDGTTTERDNPVRACGTGAWNGTDCGGGIFLAAQQISLGEYHSCGVYNGIALCWGWGGEGQLGNGGTSSTNNPQPVCENGGWNGTGCTMGGPIFDDVASIVVGEEHTCALMDATTQSGRVMCWGRNSYGQLAANLPLNDYANPVVSQFASGANFTGGTSLAARPFGTCVSTGTSVSCAGDADNHLGLRSSRADNPAPVCASGRGHGCVSFGNTVSVDSYGNTTCVRDTNDEAYCWGENIAGTIGDGSFDDAYRPHGVCSSGTWDASSSTCVAGSRLGGVSQVSTGNQHVCARLNNNTLECWGNNSEGQLGDDSSSATPNPIAVCDPSSCAMSLSGVLRVNAGYENTCAVVATPNGDTAYCWGDGDGGDGHNPSTSDEELPVPVCASGDTMTCQPLINTVDIAVGSSLQSTTFGCAVKSNGTVACWGGTEELPVRDYGIRGNGIGARIPTPQPVCQAGSGPDCTPLADIVALAPGTAHTCALHQSGEVSCWGSGDDGELGGGATSPNPVSAPQFVCASGTWDGTECVGGQRLIGVQAIASGNDMSCAILTDQTVSCWGYNADGRLGDGTFDVRVNPSTVACPPALSSSPGCQSGGALQNVVGLSISPGFNGSSHACAIIDGGFVKCWGDNDNGQLGSGDTVSREYPTDVLNIGATPETQAVTISAGGRHTCATLQSGETVCWGNNTHGELGIGTVSLDPITLPSRVCAHGSGGNCLPLVDSIAVSSGRDFSCVVRVGGQVECWGRPRNGVLGNGVSNGLEPEPNPQTVCATTDAVVCSEEAVPCTNPLTDVVSLSAGDTHSCATRSDGSVTCWGKPSYGVRGDGKARTHSETQCTPTEVCSVGGCDTGVPYQATLRTCNLIDVSIVTGGTQ